MGIMWKHSGSHGPDGLEDEPACTGATSSTHLVMFVALIDCQRPRPRVATHHTQPTGVSAEQAQEFSVVWTQMEARYGSVRMYTVCANNSRDLYSTHYCDKLSRDGHRRKRSWPSIHQAATPWTFLFQQQGPHQPSSGMHNSSSCQKHLYAILTFHR